MVNNTTHPAVATVATPRSSEIVSLDKLTFQPLTVEDVKRVLPSILSNSLRPRTCDFTVGGLFMWIDYFKYSFALVAGTLYVSGLNENDLTQQAYLLPCGAADMRSAIATLLNHCRAIGQPCVISAVPESTLPVIESVAPIKSIEPIDAWNDYLYDIDSLATLKGKKLGKKRNHVNRFLSLWPDYTFEPITDENIGSVREFFDHQELAEGKSLMADYERMQVKEVLRHPEWFGFEGAVLSVPGRGVVAFTMGEVIDDTLFVHIEKMDHDAEGAGAAINKFFAGMMKERYPGLRYVNREDDAGDEGLRQAKLSYHPSQILRKYNVTL